MLTNIMYKSFVLELWYQQCTIIVETTKNTDYYQNTCLKKATTYRLKKSKITLGNKTYATKKVVPSTYTLEKTFSLSGNLF